MLRRVAFRNQLVYVNQTIMVVGICTQQSPESCTHVDKLFPSHFRDNSDDGWWISHYLVVIVGFGLQYLQYSVVTLSYSSKKKTPTILLRPCREIVWMNSGRRLQYDVIHQSRRSRSDIYTHTNNSNNNNECSLIGRNLNMILIGKILAKVTKKIAKTKIIFVIKEKGNWTELFGFCLYIYR